MTNIDAGRQHIRRLPDRPIVGETYPNAGGLYKVDRYDAESDLAWVHRPKDGWKCCAHGPALYDVPGRGIELQWNYSTGGRFSADDCQRVTHGIGYRINAMIATIRLAIETPKASHDCTSAMR